MINERAGWRSLTWRLPVFISALLITVLAIVVYAAYREVSATLDRAQADRSRHAADQIAALLAGSMEGSAEQLRQVAPQLSRSLEVPTAENLAAARVALERLAPSSTRRLTLWDAQGNEILALPDHGVDAVSAGLPPPPPPSAPGISPIQLTSNERSYSDLAVEVPNTLGDGRLGWLVVRSVLSITPTDLFSRLIGTDATILVGNQRGDLWTDFQRRIPGPPLDPNIAGNQEYYANGNRHIGASSHVRGVPWVVWIEFPIATAAADARAFLWRMSRFGVLVALVALVMVAWSSIRLTRPLARFTAAAEAIAGGDYSKRVGASRGDEIGRLGRAFDAMAADVANAHRGLEQRVEERTRELNAALQALSEQGRVRETYLATIVDSSADAILSEDPERLITSWNKGAERLFGYTAEETIGRTPQVFIPLDRLEEDAQFARAVRGGESVPAFETVRETKDGRLIDVSITASPIIDAAGRVLGVSKVARDITQQKQAEREIRDQRDRAQQYLDTAQVILVAVDLEGRVALLNRYGCQVLGRTPDEVLGHHYWEFVPARLRNPQQSPLGEVTAGTLAISESPLLTAAGDERLIEWRHTTRLDGAGNVIGTLSSGTDITDRHRADEALRTAEERMRFALQTANIGIWDMDYATGRLACSEILEAHLGLAPGTFAGTFDAFVDRVHPDDREHTLKIIGAALREGSEFTVQHRTLWPDGTVRSLRGAGKIVLGPDGSATRGIGISLDETDQRNLEAQFQQAQKMDAVGRLAGGVAHDFNNLLTAILGYCELLLEEQSVDQSTRRALTEIQKAGNRAAALTRQLLAFSRKQIIQPTLLNLNVVVEDMRPMLERLIGEDIVTSFKPARMPAQVLADRGQIEQVIMNLAINARDAMPMGGALLIEVADVQLDEHYAAMHLSAQPGAYFALIVTDTGTGMTADVQAHLFEPFFTTKDQGKGTGLGLATVHGIVTRFGGNIGVYSELGKGTSFRVYLPATSEIAVEAAVPVAAAAPAAVRAASATVLVVDDAEGLRELARRILERRGYTVLVAGNAEEAMVVVEQHPEIDLLLTDVIMPGASGPELTRELVAKRPKLRVIYMSGYTDDAITHHGVLAAGTAFLEKPFTASALVQKVADTLQA